MRSGCLNFLQLPAFRSMPRPRNPSPFSAELPDSSNRAQIERFLDAVDLLPPDKETSVFYGQIAAGLARAGTPIPQNDIGIAALARQTVFQWQTTDDHFDRVKPSRTEVVTDDAGRSRHLFTTGRLRHSIPCDQSMKRMGYSEK